MVCSETHNDLDNEDLSMRTELMQLFLVVLMKMQLIAFRVMFAACEKASPVHRKKIYDSTLASIWQTLHFCRVRSWARCHSFGKVRTLRGYGRRLGKAGFGGSCITMPSKLFFQG